MLWRWFKNGLAWRLGGGRRVLDILFNTKDLTASISFIFNRKMPKRVLDRALLIGRFYQISLKVDSPHRQWEILTFVKEILRSQKFSSFVEAGVFKGSGTAKFSLAAAWMDSKLYVFDSFEGMPENSEPHEKSIFGQDLTVSFVKGKYAGGLEEVRNTVRTFGSIVHCEFIKGWFDETMPSFKRPISGAYIDVDLASSTRTCIRHLFPLLGPGDLLISQDGHIPLVIDVFRDRMFWKEEFGFCDAPQAHDLGSSKLVTLRKPVHINS